METDGRQSDMRIVESKDVADIRSLAKEWLKIANGEEFSMDLYYDIAAENMASLIKSGGTILLAYEDDEDIPVGFFALSPMQSFFGRQLIAMETMWFCLPNAHRAGPALLRAAKKWAVENGCSHLMVSGSRLASDLHDKVCHFCERSGGKQFETVYLMEVT